jgi:hypothetical protein
MRSRRPSPATIIATLALFFALGGTAIAAKLTYGGISMQASCVEEGGKGRVAVQAKGIQLEADGTHTQTVVQSTTESETKAVNFVVGESPTYYTLSAVEFTLEPLKNYSGAASDQYTVVPAGTGAFPFHLDLFQYAHEAKVGKLLDCIVRAAYYPLAG